MNRDDPFHDTNSSGSPSRFEEHMVKFRTGSTMEIPSHNNIRFADSHASGDGTTLQCGVNNATININQRARHIVFPKTAHDASFDAANKDHLATCLPGTRVELLKEIQEWIDGDNPNRIYWLSGMAGTGKSTIALTLAQRYKRKVGAKDRQRAVCLGATFFFSRGGGDLSSASKFAATIAIQLAETSVELRKHIENAIENNSRLDSLGIRTQWETLILQPLLMLSNSTVNHTTLLLIIDALDECDSAGDTNAIIRCLEQVTEIKGIGCRVFLTSRPEQSIRLGMDDSASVPRENFVLHKIERSIVNQDIELYYRDQLSCIKGTISSEEDVISERMIKALVDRSNGLFIHAATACRFVNNGKLLALDRLKRLLDTAKSDSAELELDKMYITVLEYSFVAVTDELSPEEAEKVRELLQHAIGAIVVMFDVMNFESLAMFLGVKREDITLTLSALHSVIDVPGCPSEPIRVIHPSFRDFLLNPNRCTDRSYLIQVPETHGHLLTRCFASMMSQLQRNILHIPKPGAKAKDISIDIIGAGISEELQYSSQYWWNHFQNSDEHKRKELPLLEFLEDKYLFWLECLAWLGKLGYAVHAIFNIDAILTGKLQQSELSRSMPSNHRKSKTASKLHTFVPDALQFLLSHKSMIEEAPLQIYVSALIFSPRSSQVRKKNRGEMPSWILNEFPGPDDWSNPSRSLSIAHSSKIYSFAISPDSTLVATACGDCMIHIWDITNGIERFRLEGNPGGVASVCFSPNGCLVASSAGNLVSVWNIQAALGARYQPEYQFCFNRQGVEPEISYHPMCAISSSGNIVTAIDYPHDIWVWDMGAKQFKYHFQVESPRSISGVYFSSDGSLLIAVTVLLGRPWWIEDDRIVDAWYISTGIKVPTEKSAPEGPFLGIFSGTRYMTIPPQGSNNGARLTLRDARTGLDEKGWHVQRLGKLISIPLRALCRPADGKILVASLEDFDFYLSVLGDKNITSRKCERDPFKYFDFSPDGKHAIFNTFSNEVRIRNIEDIGSQPSLSGKIHQSLQDMGARWGSLMRMILKIKQISSHSFTPHSWSRCRDGTLLATHGYRCCPSTICNTMAIWNTKTAEEKFRLNLPKGHHSVQFFPSGNVIAVLGNSSVHLWDTKTGKKGDILKIDDLHVVRFQFLRISEKGGKVIYIGYDTIHGPSSTKCYCWELDGLRIISGFEIPIRSRRNVQINLSANEESYCLWNRESAILEVASFQSNILRYTALRGIAKLADFMPDSKSIWVLSEAEEGRRQAIRIWNIDQDSFREVYIELPPDFTDDRCAEDHDGLDRAPNQDQANLPDYGNGFVSPDGDLLALVGHCHGYIKIDVFQASNLKALFRVKLDFVPRFIEFAPSGTHLITERGGFLLPGASPPSPLLSAMHSWIQEDGEDILAITPKYRYSLQNVHGHTITFSDSDERPVSLRLDEGVKTMIV